MQGELAHVVDDGVAGVAATLIPDHDVITAGIGRSTMRPLPSSPQLMPTIAQFAIDTAS